MTSPFFDVFPDLKLKDNLKGMFAETTVDRVITTRLHDRIKIHMSSDRLIDKKDIYIVGKEIEKQLFAGMGVTVIIMEKFNLSEQYTAKNLYNVYKDSILLELSNDSSILAAAMRGADVDFSSDDVMEVTVSGSGILNKIMLRLTDYLYGIFVDRCGLCVSIKIKSRQNEDTEGYEDSNFYPYERQILENQIVENQISKNQISENPSGGERKAENPGKFQKRVTVKSTNRNPDVLFGKEFAKEITPLEEIGDSSGNVVIRGMITDIDNREIKNERTIVSVTVTDFTDTIRCKMFVKNENLGDITDVIKIGDFIKVSGVAMYDAYDKEVSITSVNGIMRAADTRVKRTDTCREKRVELHCHTKMSDMDGVSDVGDIIKRAISWGHKALAITDHGCVQAFTDAYHVIKDIEGKYAKNNQTLDFKVIYGMEAYLVDDSKKIATNPKGQSLDGKFTVFDIETTGFSAVCDKIIEIGAVKIEDGKIIDRFSEFINPGIPVPFRIEELTGINDGMLAGADTIEAVLKRFFDFSEGTVLIAHNADFDMSFIIHNREKCGYSDENEFTYCDTVALARALLPGMGRYKLDAVAKALGIPLNNHHRAVDDAECTAHIYIKFMEMLKETGIEKIDDIDVRFRVDDVMIGKLPSHHAIILAGNETGRVNLYRLVSDSNIKYFHRNPRIPKSLLEKYREGLIIGSACEAGEVYRAVYGGRSDREIARLVNFYDYLEIQPVGNNMFMADRGEVDVERLIDINKTIVKLGERFGKPVVATCDVHFLDPVDEIYRRIIMYSKGFDDADRQAPLYFRTTDEMLAEFEYLGSKKAYEVVVTNTNKIADMTEKISPVSPDKAPPVIPDSDKMLRRICYKKAHGMYGENLPEIVERRLERELNSIIGNGYAVMYIIAQKLVWKSNEDGYLVGSRGSVGSSFVATMAGITEVNPLKPHYYCEKCQYSDFDSPEVIAYEGGAGCDMPEKNCPVCGEKLMKDGFDIPFETFLGFKGNKEPDIDLNFSGEYQSKAHEYTEVIFGRGQTFRAGTIGTLADKTAYGYVKKYYDEHGISKRGCEMERIAGGCVGVRRTTGQHPGGIVVLPYGQEIYKFTPVQRPANDMTTNTVTTHFDYHSIEHNLLKLDILGHDDPTMIRMLEELTGVKADRIPLDNKEVMSLFENTKALGIEPEDIGGCRLGCLGIPEFGTDFVIQMVIDAKPKNVSDLVRISGLSHGTDVWLSNAQTLIQEGRAELSTAICTRDDIMIYLIKKGLDPELSFKIMESVRKGKGLVQEWETEMLAHDVPEWYIWSCKKIKYMFPKAHAAAYVMMACRIAYFKIFYPLAYYAAFFSIRATAFDYEKMCRGKQKLEFFMGELYAKKEREGITSKEEDMIKDMRIVQEMYARGYEFKKIDIYRASSSRFKIIDGKIMPSLSAIDGMGERAAEAVAEAVKDGPFMSIEDLRLRTKVSKSVSDTMCALELLDGLPESNQLSLFDF